MLKQVMKTDAQHERERCAAARHSAECRCGHPKMPGAAFCMSCTLALPEALRRGTYRKIGDGFESAFREACYHLRELGVEG
ncbi:MAG: hypothetical protein M0036_05075 [Desulfobacteraceae bacterium]|nr:hypothetical protein [Desulfobacteraceae bacterium]